MTEQEWLSSTDPQVILRAMEIDWDEGGTYSRISDRKLRLFACAWWRSIGSHSDLQELLATGVEEYGQFTTPIGGTWGTDELLRDCQTYRDDPRVCATGVALLRTIVGNPWRPGTLPEGRQECGMCDGSGTSLLLKREGDCCRCDGRGWFADTCPWLAWKDGTVPKLAQVIYDERRWDLMPILADALEEAGCTKEVILRWCRGEELCHDCMGEGELRAGSSAGIVYSQCNRCVGPDGYGTGWIPRRGPSVRGDWCIDLLLGKE